MAATVASVFITGGVYSLSNDGTQSSPWFQSQSNIVPSTHSFHVVCYGDSLTAGVSPPSEQNEPYGPYLQSELNDIQKSAEASAHVRLPPVVVTWRGIPGWTAQDMIRNANHTRLGVRPFVGFSPRTPDVAVLLAGTNDLGRNRSTDDIVADVVQLHEIFFEMGIKRTVALGIPPSAWQASHPEAAAAANHVNLALEKYCNSTLSKAASSDDAQKEGGGNGDDGRDVSGLAKYVPFPIPFETNNREYWAKDGLHFTQKGYAQLGRSLAGPVEEILSELRRVNAAAEKTKKSWFRKKDT